MSSNRDLGKRVSGIRTENPVRHLTIEDLFLANEDNGTSKKAISLRKLLVEGLLSFKESTEFEFGQLNILVGPNGSGKSNLIDCLRVFKNAPLDIQETFKESGFEDWLSSTGNPPNDTASLELIAGVSGVAGGIRHQLKLGRPRNSRAQVEEAISSFDEYDLESNGMIHFTGSYKSHGILYSMNTSKRKRERRLSEQEYDSFRSILSQIRDIGQYPEITRLGSFYSGFRIYSEWSFGRSSSLREATHTGRTDNLLSESMDNLALVLNGLEKTAAHEEIRSLLKELKESYEDFVTRIAFGRVGLALVESPFDSPIPAKRLSDGTLRFLALAAILLHPQPPSLICLEEPELGMHPDMIRMVSRLITEAASKTQLIVTTHSELLLTSLQDDFDALFAFDAGLEGSLIRRFSKEEFLAWQEEHTLGELWTSGELGGNRW